jgi:hypothetical protein
VPGRPIWFKTHRAYLPLFLRLGVLLDQVEPLKVGDTWSYAYRAPRLSGQGVSDHAGYAIDVWTTRSGAQGRRPTAAFKAKVMKVLDQFVTSDGRQVFGWGGLYKNVPDAMHFFVNPGISPKDAAAVAKSLKVASDGTIRG